MPVRVLFCNKFIWMNCKNNRVIFFNSPALRTLLSACNWQQEIHFLCINFAKYLYLSHNIHFERRIPLISPVPVGEDVDLILDLEPVISFYFSVTNKSPHLVWNFNDSTAWKVSKYGVISGPYFPVFGLNTGKYGPEITPYLDTFHAV